jgi:photosystem II stability/assembly factor-like uncharacterized protein
MKGYFFLFSLLFLQLASSGQTIEVLTEKGGVSFRGLSIVDSKTAWVSGSSGTIGKTVDGGSSWQWLTVEGYSKTDFRDIEAFDKNRAVIMGVGSPGVILRTEDGGKTWKKAYENVHPDFFMDAMHFWNEMSGIIIGDPIDGKFFILRTFDGGNTWMEMEDKDRPVALEGEACFAASGSNVTALDRDEACFVTGSGTSRIFIRDRAVTLPLQTGPSAGANAVAVKDNHKYKGGNFIYVVGGDFNNDTARAGNAAYSADRGQTWQIPEIAPFGYRSSVEFIGKNRMIACGTSGVDISDDNGITWRNISESGFHVVKKSKKGNLVLLAGSNGRIARLKY